ncbi:photosynthetic complex putative assembly protein PuhB [Tabrizicola caldifontis]|uniref:photosynthetic complex putative assembly protein PuhB n=1 Tax=Tabrizicola caldifontis TaxID=2528036 RepID=UPI00108058F6|nr:photosynthetic complex putative assembly protein PuhB [Rhodobacter sp. YIM 73028]
MSGHDDFAFDALPGLPERPPRGELILWQGRPDPWALARDAYKIRWFAVYFALIVIWRAGAAWADGGLSLSVAVGLPYLALGLLGLAVIYALAWAQARATTYTLTTARVVMRIGAALPVTFNIPFRQVGTASLDLRRDGTGTIALETIGETRISVLVAWPHLRPGHWKKTQPALRSIPDAGNVARMLAEAAEARLTQPAIVREPALSPVAAE